MKIQKTRKLDKETFYRAMMCHPTHHADLEPVYGLELAPLGKLRNRYMELKQFLDSVDTLVIAPVKDLDEEVFNKAVAVIDKDLSKQMEEVLRKLQRCSAEPIEEALDYFNRGGKEEEVVDTVDE